MTIDEIIGAAKIAKEKERVVLGRYRLTLADLGILRTIRRLREKEVSARVKFISAIYGEGLNTAEEDALNRRAVRDIASDGVEERMQERQRVHQDALRRLMRK